LDDRDGHSTERSSVDQRDPRRCRDRWKPWPVRQSSTSTFVVDPARSGIST
jgi:hypothetical protein